MFFSTAYALLHSGDSALAGRAAQGDRAAQREIFHALKSTVHATLYRVLGSNEHMEDLLQDVFIEVFRSLGSYRGEAKLTTWADRIAVRVAFHYLKRQSGHELRELDSEPPSLRLVGSPEDDAQHREGVARVYAALGKLKPEYRIAFALFALDGRSIEEIASITNVSLVAAKSRISRGRHKLWSLARKDDVLMTYLVEQVEGDVE